jgi:hypothetical protein
MDWLVGNASASSEGLLRVVDDSGENDLDPAGRFVVVAAPDAKRRGFSPLRRQASTSVLAIDKVI